MARGGGGRGGYGRGGGGRGGGGGGDGISAALDALDQAMLDNFNEYRMYIHQTWDQFAGNNGQLTIIRHHIMPVSRQHIHQAKEEWPYSSDPDEYLDSLMSAYDPDVIERAFGETVYDLYDTIGPLWEETDSIQREHDDLLGHSAVHSTNPPWRA